MRTRGPIAGLACVGLWAACADGAPVVTSEGRAPSEAPTGAIDPWQATTPLDPRDAPPTSPPTSPPTGTEPGAGPQLVVAEGAEVVPQTVVHLGARWAEVETDGDDPIAGWAWSVAQPDGAVARFEPSATASSPTLEVDVAGRYELAVTLRRASGASSSARFALAVVPDQALHVELLWHTPGDPDEADTGLDLAGDSVGADLDLHLARHAPGRLGPGGDATSLWYGPGDTYWLAPGSWDDPAGSPTLDRDDTDGAGPENVNVGALAADACFAIGAHAWDDWGFGPSTATVRVWLGGALAFEAEATLAPHDLWFVGDVCGPDGAITDAARCDEGGCAPRITPAFPVPLGVGAF